MQDGQRLVVVVTEYLEKAKAPGAADFQRLAASLLIVGPTVESLDCCHRKSHKFHDVSLYYSQTTSPTALSSRKR